MSEAPTTTALSPARPRANSKRPNGTKSRNGCQRCKLKRLKCDETKPSCLKCTSKQHECPGYAPKQLHWSTKHEVLLRKPNPEPELLAAQSVAECINATASDRRPINIEDQVLGTRLGPAAVQYSPPQQILYDGSEVSRPNCGPLGIYGTPGGFAHNSLFAVDYISDEQMSEADMLSNSQSPAIIPHPSFVLPISSQQIVARNSSDGLEPSDDALELIRRRLWQNSPISGCLIHMPTILVDHYFDYICTIFSTFDSSVNPFRATVGRLWNGWAPMYYAIQSMAAASLANDFPQFRPIGMHMQQDAYKSLNQVSLQEHHLQKDNSDKILLTILMLGLTTGWHRSNDLGLIHQGAAKRLLRKRLSQETATSSSQERRQNQFFVQCLLYWEMLTAFVSDTAKTGAIEALGIYDDDSPILGPPVNIDEVLAFPHPWTGITPRVHALFAETGALVRKSRNFQVSDVSHYNYLNLDPQPDILDLIGEELAAQNLEEKLLALESPSATDLVDTGDAKTPPDHYLKINEAYRSTALLLIYRTFPNLLNLRLAFEGTGSNSEYFQFLPEASSQSSGSWLTSLATHVLDILEELPCSSGTRFLQPILLLAAGSELRFSDVLAGFGSAQGASTFLNGFDAGHINVARARRFTMKRLHELQVALPSKPIEQVVKIVRETWDRVDGGADSFWLDVMIENHWETIMG